MMTDQISVDVLTSVMMPDRVEVRADNTISVHIIKTPEGYVVDVYDMDDELIDTMTVWTFA